MGWKVSILPSEGFSRVRQGRMGWRLLEGLREALRGYA